jgi:phosphopantetheine adenylyltransferase
MKKFSQFLLEFRGSKAAEKAYRLGLVSNKHGEWLDRSGKIVAKTVDGDLEMVRKKSPSPEKAQQAPISAKKIEPKNTKLAKTAPPVKVNKIPTEVQPPELEVPKDITIVFGRFNPPTIGHEKLLKKARDISNGGGLRIYPSRTQDNKQNPLSPQSKIKYMRMMFPDFKDNIVNDKDMKTIFDVLVALNQDGYESVNIVVGANRVSEFERLSNQYNNQLYNYSNINIVSAGPRDPDSLGLDGMSSSKLRKAAVDDDYHTFRNGIPRRMKEKDVRALFFAVQRPLKGKGSVKEMFTYAPKLDKKNLRENYYSKKIFNVGSYVQNVNTGLTGKISRRGPNYVIYVTENNQMLKSWIDDLTEWTEISGVPSDQREVGTDPLRKYVMRLTNTRKIKNFIKSYKSSLNTK